jgi:hypothetical protein
MRRYTYRTGLGLRLLACIAAAFSAGACALGGAESGNQTPVRKPQNYVRPSPEVPVAELELVDKRNSRTDSAIGKFDFKNFTYPLPRGWQDADGGELTLVDGRRRTTEEKIGMEYLSTKYFDATGNGEDDAVVILRIGTAGSAIPHIVYLFEWKEGEPNLIWYFRTGDRADGGLKNIYPDGGDVAVELFGKDRYIFGEMETLKITGDEVQLCCPTHFTKTKYKWRNGSFYMDGDRLTYPVGNSDAEPVVNMGELEAKGESESRK